jgi:antagonist of KipI
VTISVLGAGLQTTVQDLGRPRQQHAAIPAGGAMDRLACRAANLLVGNDERDALLEATLIGPTIRFDEETLIALAGGDLDPTIDGRPLPLWRPVRVPAGAVLRFGQARIGCRGYLAIAGGLDVPMLFDSRSTYLRGGFGGLNGRALRAGDAIRAREPGAVSRAITRSLAGDGVVAARFSLARSLRPHYAEQPVVRVIRGMHADALDDASAARLTSDAFRISASSDRMGYRLEGRPLTLRAPVELLSEGVAFGTIQLPPGGAPIVLMADRQTAGGYPRIGEIASVDLPLVAQLKPGDSLRFREVSLAEAQRAYLQREMELRQAAAALTLRFIHGK